MAAILEEMVNFAYHTVWWMDCVPQTEWILSHTDGIQASTEHTHTDTHTYSLWDVVNWDGEAFFFGSVVEYRYHRCLSLILTCTCLSFSHTRAHTHTHTHTRTHTHTPAPCSPSRAVLQTPSGMVKSWQLLSACILLLSFSPLLIHHLSLCVSLTRLPSLCET